MTQKEKQDEILDNEIKESKKKGLFVTLSYPNQIVTFLRLFDFEFPNKELQCAGGATLKLESAC